jgi:uncharacterized metal-binding protein
MASHDPNCAACPYEWPEKYCRGEGGRGPSDCPTLRHRDLTRLATEEAVSQENLEFVRQASIQEAEGYAGREEGYGCLTPAKPRLLETIEFAKRMGYNRVCLAFCMGLRQEAVVVQDIFEDHGLEVISVVCKVGRVSKDVLGLGKENQVDIFAAAESMCHPVLQAEIANECGAQLNVMLGLCVGHDSLFLKHANAPCTVLAVKDRVLGHNPLAAVYNSGSYWRSLKKPKG